MKYHKRYLGGIPLYSSITFHTVPKSGNKLYADFTELFLLAFFLLVLFLLFVFLLVFLAHFADSLR